MAFSQIFLNRHILYNCHTDPIFGVPFEQKSNRFIGWKQFITELRKQSTVSDAVHYYRPVSLRCRDKNAILRYITASFARQHGCMFCCRRQYIFDASLAIARDAPLFKLDGRHGTPLSLDGASANHRLFFQQLDHSGAKESNHIRMHCPIRIKDSVGNK